MFPLIDILRGFAAISVVMAHCIFVFRWTAFPSDGPLAWFRIGWLGVDLFFVISGLVIGLSAFAGLERDAEGFAGRFIRHRLCRIVPLYLLTGVVFVAAIQPQLIAAPDFWGNVAAHLAFVHNLFPGISREIDAPNWTIGVEMQFYLVMLAAAPWLRRADWRLIAVVTFGIAWAWRFGAFLLIDTRDPAGAFRLEVAANQLPGVLDEFGLGILLARAIRGQAGRHLRALPWSGAGMTVVAAALVWGALTVFWLHPGFWDLGPMVVWFRSLAGLAAASVILCAMLLASPLAVSLSAPLRYLGTISYGIYLWHWLLIDTVLRFGDVPPGLAMAAVLGPTLLLAAASWRWVERPVQRRFARPRLACG